MTTETKTFWESKNETKKINIKEITHGDGSGVEIITSVINMDPERSLVSGNYSQATFDLDRLRVTTECRNMDGKNVYAYIEVKLTDVEMRRLAVQLINNLDIVEP